MSEDVNDQKSIEIAFNYNSSAARTHIIVLIQEITHIYVY